MPAKRPGLLEPLAAASGERLQPDTKTQHAVAMTLARRIRSLPDEVLSVPQAVSNLYHFFPESRLAESAPLLAFSYPSDKVRQFPTTMPTFGGMAPEGRGPMPSQHFAALRCLTLMSPRIRKRVRTVAIATVCAPDPH